MKSIYCKLVQNKILRYASVLALSFGLAMFVDGTDRYAFLLLAACMLLYLRIIKDNLEEGRVSLRKVLLLCAGLILCSKHPFGAAFFLVASAIIILRISSQLMRIAFSILVRCRSDTDKARGMEAPPFTLCFLMGMMGILFFLFMAGRDGAFLFEVDAAMDRFIVLMPLQVGLNILSGLFVALAIVECLVAGIARLAKKRLQEDRTLQRQDVLLLPSFAVFLGSGFFLASLCLAIAIRFFIHSYQVYVLHQEVRP